MEANNINGKIAADRDIWLNMERHLLDELMEKIENKRKIEGYNKYVHADKLYNKAIRLIEEIESGELEDDTIKKNVEEITLLFAAIEDAERGPMVREKNLDEEELKEMEEKARFKEQILHRIKNLSIKEKEKAPKEVDEENSEQGFER